MTNSPAIWMIVFIVGLSQLSETVYSASLPTIANALNSSEAMAEYTMSSYLFGFSIGTLFWGIISDKLGRKPCVIAGLVIFIFGCISCYYSSTINMLMISRAIQAFGGGIGSILGQAICRDAFHGAKLGKVYSSIGSALAVFPAIGPVIGGFISENFGWPSIFLFLILTASILILLVTTRLPETHINRQPVAISTVLGKIIQDKKVIGFGLIVAATNGIVFSYFSEGSFYLMQMLGLTAHQYGLSFMFIATAPMVGGMVSRKLHDYYDSKTIMGYGLRVILAGTTMFSTLAMVHHYLYGFPNHIMIAITLVSHMTVMFGSCITTGNALSLALVDYKWCVGTASSLFGFFYYSAISLFTIGMGLLHNGTLLPMPLYFFSIAVFLMAVQNTMLKTKDAPLGLPLSA